MSLPPGIGTLRCLTHLDLSFNRLSTLPSCILHLLSLRVLLVSHNSLVTLPEDFGSLRRLTFFSAMKNQLKDLPQSIGELAELQDLDLSENALEFLPDEVGNLQNCTELDLSGNRLLSIPDSLGKCFVGEEKGVGWLNFQCSLGLLRPLVWIPRAVGTSQMEGSPEETFLVQSASLSINDSPDHAFCFCGSARVWGFGGGGWGEGGCWSTASSVPGGQEGQERRGLYQCWCGRQD